MVQPEPSGPQGYRDRCSSPPCLPRPLPLWEHDSPQASSFPAILPGPTELEPLLSCLWPKPAKPSPFWPSCLGGTLTTLGLDAPSVCRLHHAYLGLGLGPCVAAGVGKHRKRWPHRSFRLSPQHFLSSDRKCCSLNLRHLRQLLVSLLPCARPRVVPLGSTPRTFPGPSPAAHRGQDGGRDC